MAMTQRTLWNTLKVHGKMDNKEAHAVSVIIWTDVKEHLKNEIAIARKEELAKFEEQRMIEPRLSDEERKEALELKLDSILTDPTTSAADIKEFRDYYGLGSKKADVYVTIADYVEIDPDTFDIAKAVSMQIERANDTSDATS